MARPKNRNPSYLLHKPSGQARVRIDGRDHYLGLHGSQESWQKFHRLLAESACEPRSILPADSSATIHTLAHLFQDHAQALFGPASENHYTIKRAIIPLVKLYGDLPAAQFTPKKLKAVREHIIKDGHWKTREVDEATKEVLKPGKPLSRSYVNKLVATIKQIFKWAVSEDMLPVTVYLALKEVETVQKGRNQQVREPKKVKPAPAEHVELVKDRVSDEIAAMIDLQLLTGMRPDEVTIMRPCDIRREPSVWVYTIRGRHDGGQGYKTDHLDDDEAREIYIGPKAQKVLAPWLEATEPTDYLFSPRRVVEKFVRREKEKNGKDPNVLQLHKTRPPRDHYDDTTYGRAVRRACIVAGIPVWSPNQLRHNAGTRVRAKHGLEASKLVLGHRHVSTTEIYAEQDTDKYRAIIKAMG